MAKRNSRPGWIAFGLIALALLAVVAWKWQATSRSERAHAAQAVAMPPPATRSLPPSPRVALHAGGATNRDDDDSAESVCSRDYKRNLRDFREQLGPARNADEAFDRAMLDVFAGSGGTHAFKEYQRELAAAQQRWPDDLELSWLGYAYCRDGCDRDAQLRHLLEVDPDNAAAWMAAMAAAQSNHDEQGLAHALQRAANAKIYDSRMGVVFLHARSVLAHAPVPGSCVTAQALAGLRGSVGREPTNDDRLDIMSFAVESAIASPALSGIARCATRATTPPLPDVQQKQCMTLLSRVAQADTLLEQQIATGWLLGLESDPARLARLRERYRELQWLQKATFGRTTPEHYATRVWSQGEVATMQALAMERGLWPPPPDWLPDDPQIRARITGQPPAP